MDVGEDIRRTKANALANKIAQSDFMQGWLFDNQQNFIETMELIRTGAPVKYAELYARIYGMGITKDTNININFNRQQDRDALQGLVRSHMPSLATKGEYTPYEEVNPEPLPAKVGRRKKEEQ